VVAPRVWFSSAARNSVRHVPQSGRHVPEWQDDILRNRWTACIGITGRHAPESAPADYVEAVRWLRLAAEQGNPFAQSSLGTAYYNGDGVPQDDVLAYMWYNLAATQGNEDGQDYKDEIEPLLTREQIAEAQRLSREWIAAHPPGGN